MVTAIFICSTSIMIIAIGKDRSGKSIVIASNKLLSQDIEDLSNLLQSTIEEVYEKTRTRPKEVLVGLASNKIHISKNRDYINLEAEDQEIDNKDISTLTNKLYTIEPFSGTRILNVVPFEYSVDDEFRIKDPVGMCGKRLGGTFYILFGECFIVDRIVNGLISCKLEVKKFIPSHLNDAEPFLTKEELELLSLTKGLFNPDLE